MNATEDGEPASPRIQIQAKLDKIDKVLSFSSIGATLVFTVVGVFGYLTFSNSP